MRSSIETAIVQVDVETCVAKVVSLTRGRAEGDVEDDER
jgi:hypothetical protein